MASSQDNHERPEEVREQVVGRIQSRTPWELGNFLKIGCVLAECGRRQIMRCVCVCVCSAAPVSKHTPTPAFANFRVRCQEESVERWLLKNLWALDARDAVTPWHARGWVPCDFCA